MNFKVGDIVLHTTDNSVIGIVTSLGNVEWWTKKSDNLLLSTWNLERHKQYLYLVDLNYHLSKNFKARIQELGFFLSSQIYKETDSPLVRKIKELDYKWECHMKKKGTFYLTSRAQDANPETISEPIPTDIATALAVDGISQANQTSNSSTSRSQHIRHWIPTTGQNLSQIARQYGFHPIA